MKAPARALADNLIWSTDGGVWAAWAVESFPHAHTSTEAKLAIHARLRGLLIGLPAESFLLSVCERLDPYDVVADMLDGVDPTRTRWAEVCAATAEGLAGMPLHRRRYYLAAALPRATGSPLAQLLREAADAVGASFGLAPAPLPTAEVEARRRQASALAARLRVHVPLRALSAGEIRWLYARALRRAIDDPPFDDSWEPPVRQLPGGRRSPSVLAQLTDALVREGGSRDDPNRPGHRRYVRVDTTTGTAFQSALAVADLPHSWTFPGGGGEWLTHVDDLGLPIDWAVRVHSVPNAAAQAKVRRQHRQLVGQVDEYDGETTGAPPSLAEAIAAVDAQRAELAANPAEPELQATIILSLAAPTLPELEDQAGALCALFEPHDYGLGRPTGGQLALLRSMLPGTAAAPVCRDYTQFLLPTDLAAGAPFCGPEVGDPSGLLLGTSLDSGVATPVLFDPTFGPAVGRTASLAAVGALGSGKSFFLKRLCWDTIARGGQVVVVDRTARGEYAVFGGVAPGRAQIVRLGAEAEVCLDPLRTFSGEGRAAVTLGFLSLLAGCSPHSDEGAALAEAVHAVASQPSARLGQVVDVLHRMGDEARRPDPAARSLARRLDHYRRLGAGRLAFGDGEPVTLDADCIVFWAPNLALPDRDTLVNEHLARQMLPEHVLGHALLYLVAAVGRQVVFSDPGRFGAALYDEAWAVLASPHGQRLVLEGIRDGRKHNGAIWLASQHPNDLGVGELVDLVGSRFVFRQAPGAAERALEFLGVGDSDGARAVLDAGLGTGCCLYRDVRDRIGVVQIAEPALAGLHAAFDTTPPANPMPDRRPAVATPPPARLAALASTDAKPEPAARPTLAAGTADGDGSHRMAAARAQARRHRRTPLAVVLAQRDEQ
ncbi:MAG: ATP-binding protein [Actinobacteria bacterium]|nr:ATP-binding protein [Actinomycetota bacterium]